MARRISTSFSVPVLIVLIVSVLPACTTQRPLISHAHVGHALTTWHDTPGKKGLMEVAAGDLAIAEREAELACRLSAGPASRQHAANLIHALVPEAQPDGPGSGYGAIRALMGTIEHLEYAATSDDASLNFIQAIVALTLQGEMIHDRLKTIIELTQAMASSSAAEFARHCQQLERDMQLALHGGAVSNSGEMATIGFVALQAELQAMLDREHDPAYAPVPRRYVLGLVRLPNGSWGYRLPRAAEPGLVFHAY